MVRSERGGTRDEKLRMWNEGKGVRVGGDKYLKKFEYHEVSSPFLL